MYLGSLRGTCSSKRTHRDRRRTGLRSSSRRGRQRLIGLLLRRKILMSDCLFCGIVEGKVHANIVYQDDSVVVFKDIRPRAPVHFLIILLKLLVSVLD